MLYEMVVGKVPFNADTPFSVIHDHIYSPLPLPHTVNPKVPESVERVLLKALAKERDDRYENVAQMVTAFKDAWAQAGVPMQGTFIKISQPLKPLETVAPKAELIKAVADSGSTKMVVNAEPTEASSQPGEKRSTSAWLWVGAALIIVLCIGTFMFARNNRLFARFIAASRAPTNTAESFSLSTSVPNPPPSAPSTGQQLPPPEVMEAQRRANDKPNDPNAQLDLAFAFWNANMPGATYEALGKVVRLAGPANEPFYMQAGDKFATDEGWLPAAFMYFQVVQLRAQTSEGVPDQIRDAFREAMYKSADRPEVATIVPFDKVAEVDTTITFVTRARHALYTGRIQEAHDLIDQLKQYEDTSREGYLLEGELASVEGDQETARQFLQGLAEDQTSTPEWVRLFAAELLERLP